VFTEATNTRLEAEDKEGDVTRLASRRQLVITCNLKRVSNVCVCNREGAAEDFGKDIHILKCVNRNHRFFEVGVADGTDNEEGGILIAS